MPTFRKQILILITFTGLFFSCKHERKTYIITGDIEDPKNEITQAIADLVNKEMDDSLVVKLGINVLSNLDSLEKGVYHFMVVDNYVPYRENISAVVPLYPQILHVLYKNNYDPKTFKELVTGKKIYAGVEGTSSFLFIQNLLNDFQVPEDSIEFVSVLDLFDAEVIFSFTDLISTTELRDLGDFRFFSFDDPDKLGSGSLSEAICLRYPQFQPYIIPKSVYGEYTPEPVLTISNEAILVCRKDFETDFIYDLSKVIHENKQVFSTINPLLFHGISEDYMVQDLSFTLHPGARRYLERNKPSIFEKYAELIGVVFSILFAIITAGYTLYNVRKSRKKNKIDVYYLILVNLRETIPGLKKILELDMVLTEVKRIQKETIDLLVREKLNADASFLIFMQLSQLVTQEATEMKEQLETRG